MTETRTPLTALQKAAVTIKSLRAKADAAERARRGPIAIVGMSCRLPARSNTPEALWEALRTGTLGSMPVPGERWDMESVFDPEPGKPGKMYVSKACFIEGVDRFDPLFFRISPRDAVGIDPQQRLLLEVVHEGLEDAGIPPSSLSGSRTGVFLGISTNDYSALLSRSAHGSGSNAAAGAGNAASVASGRISYTFGFRGPCFAVDTACSSSLVTTHLAAQSLRTGESDIALVAGVNLMLTPDITINFCQGRMLSPEGLCKTFDASADGYVRGEGCGVVVLKRLEDALASGDRVIALISGSAINQDGKSAGLTAPNGNAQVEVIRQALSAAGLSPDEIDFVEAHGTGTELGDPIEMHALRSVFEGRSRPLGVGSVKSSIGHTEAAAGVSGVIKAALMLRHQMVPPHPCFQQLNPHIELGTLPIDIARHASNTTLNHVGVSSFGFSGTNAHVILSAAPEAVVETAPVTSDNPESVLLISAQSEAALRELIERYGELLCRNDVSFVDVCYSAQVERARYKWWVLARSADELASLQPSDAALPTVPTLKGRRIAVPKTPFERRRYWVDAEHQLTAAPRPVATSSAPCSLLGRQIDLPFSTEQRFESVIGSGLPGLEFLAEHVVAGQVLVPAAAMLDIAVRTRPGWELRDVVFVAPLPLVNGQTHHLQLICDANYCFRLVSHDPAQTEGAIVHARGQFVPADSSLVSPLEPSEGEHVDSSQFYQSMADYGVVYGEQFQRLQDIRAANGAASARLSAVAPDEARFTTMIDAALQLVAVALHTDNNALLLPARVGRVQFTRMPDGDAQVRVSAQRQGAQAQAQVQIFDTHGLAVLLHDVVFRAAAGKADHGMHQIVWREQPLAAANAQRFPAAQDLVTELSKDDISDAEPGDVADYAAAEQSLERLATAYAGAALTRLGLQFEPGAEFSLGSIKESLGIAENHQRLFAHLLGFLVDDGVLERRGRRWRVLAEPSTQTDSAELLIERHPSMAAEIAVLTRCGEALDGVLQGTTDPLQLLFGSGQEGASSFYSGSAYADTVNAQVRHAVASLARTTAAPLRVLEIGAGTGGTTQAVMDALEGHALRYDFTDISPAFLSAAQRNFPRDGLRTRRLDIESDPLSQGFEAGCTDIVIAANVLHATVDIAQSLAHVRRLLAPGGMLILVESTQARRWVDIVFGLTSGWWRFEDSSLRPNHPLLSSDSWKAVLREAGFEPGVAAGVEVMLARASLQPGADDGEHVALSGDIQVDLAQRLGDGCPALVECGEEQHRIHFLAPVACEEQAQLTLFESLCQLIAELAQRQSMPRLTLVAHSNAGHGGLAGFVRSLRLEHPECRPRLFLGQLETDESLLDVIGQDPEEEVLYADGRRRVARLAPLNDTKPVRVRGTWLICGGSGGLGRAIATQLVQLGAERLVLIGRRRPTELPEFDVPSDFFAGDVADEAFLNTVTDEVGQLSGVVHAAGLLSNAQITAQTPDTAARVFHAKLGGALALHRVLRGHPLDHFVLFASAAGVLGSARQANHAFASSFLDALAAELRESGFPALAIDWGVWREIGSAARLGFDTQAEELGLGSIDPAAGVAAFGAALSAADAQILITPGADYGRFSAHFQPRAPRLYAELDSAPVMGAEAIVEAPKPQVESVPAGMNVQAGLTRIVTELLQLEAPADPSLPLFEYGLDSLVAVEIKNRAETELGLQIQVRDLIEGASISKLLADHVVPIQPPVSAPAPAERLYAIIAELLSLHEPLDPQKPLFEYGLDSLVAVEIKNRVEKELGIVLAVRDLIEGACAAALVSNLASSAQPAAAAAVRRIVADGAHSHEPFPLTEIQQAYWLGSRDDMSLGSVGCYLYTEFDSDRVDIARLEDAWNLLIKRHGMLRLQISTEGNQRILTEVPRYPFAIADLREMAPEQSENELLQIRKRLAGRVVAPNSWPLFDISVSLHGKKARIHTGFDLIALDAASIHALRLEWAALYDNPEAILAPIGLSFRDVVLEAQQFRKSAVFARSEAYWLARLDTLPGAPDLPLAEQAASSKPSFRRYRIVLQKDRADALKAACRARSLTLAGVLAAAYADILASWSRDPCFSITVTSFNRPDLHTDIGALLGDFTSTLLLEVDARPAQFEQRVRLLVERLASDLDHAHVGGVQVLRERSKRRGGGLQSVPVVFTSALGFRDAGRHAAKSASAGWDKLGTTVYNVSSTPQVWIDHQVSEEDGQLFCNWDVLEGIFPDGLIETMTQAHERMLLALADGPGWDWALRQALPDARRAPLLPAPAPELLHRRFCQLAESQPDALALLAPERRMSYAVLHRGAANLALRLSQELGSPAASRDRLVAICLEKGWQQIVAVLGIGMAGAAYLPIDPAWPSKRRRQLLESSAAVALDPTWIDVAMEADETPELAEIGDTDRLAYVIYTSGSTGEPKGVMIEHAAAFTTIEAVNRRWNVGPTDRCFALSSLSFDLSVYDIFGPLSAGGAVVIPAPSTQPDPAHWAQVLEQGEVTLWNSAPALMNLMLEFGLPRKHALRLVLLSGDWIPLETANALREQAENARLICLGGATEAAIWSNFHQVDELDPSWHSIPYGTPLDGQTLHIVGRDGAELPDWCIGDICISGAGLARGYLNDDKRSAERFPVDQHSGQRRYQTGDIGRHRPYSSAPPDSPIPIEFLGREDFQVKVQGHRIELGEIEAVLEQHPGVARAVASAFSTGSGHDKILGAFVVAEATQSPPLPFAKALEAAQAEANSHAVAFEPQAFDQIAQFLTRQTAITVASACRTLSGCPELRDAEQLIEQHGVAPRYRDWLARTLPLAREVGDCVDEPQSIRELPVRDFFELGMGELELFDQSVDSLPDILTEKRHSADIYLSAQTPEVYGRLFEAPNRIIASAVAALAKAGPLSILEVGGGLGTTLTQLAEALEQSAARYRFTDTSQAMLNVARRRFGERDWLEYAVLDMQVKPAAEAERYDLILATSALHVATDVAQALAALRQRLKPGGVLIALEQTRFFPWYDLSMGLQSGFDARIDRELRPDHPLLDRDSWQALLTGAGFNQIAIPVAMGSLNEHLGFDVILAQSPQASATAVAEPESLRQWLAARLPAYMVPRHFGLIERLPLSANGKIERSALHLPTQTTSGAPCSGDALQREVSELVAACLGVENVEPAQSLFELGATSLSLVTLQRRIGEGFGRAIPLQAIFEQPTVESLVALLAGDTVPTSPVIRFHKADENSDRPRLFMMPGILSLPFYLRDLAALLAPEIELLSVQLPGLFGDEIPLDRIEDQVDYVLTRIRKAQPHGPYLIGGHSFGGTIAFEAARRLREEGEQVPVLVLADSVRTRSRLEAFQQDEVAQLAMLRALLALYGDQVEFDTADVGIDNARESLDRLTAQLREKQILGNMALSLERMGAMFKANFRALGSFEAQPLPGDLALIRTDEGFPVEFVEHEPAETLADPSLGWSDLVQGRLLLSCVPGDHMSLMTAATLEPTAQILRDLIRDAMEIQARQRITLPAPAASTTPMRRSVRRYANSELLDLMRVGSLLESMATVESEHGPLQRYPSAGNIYPVQVWLHLTSNCDAAQAGLYTYDRQTHELVLVELGAELPCAAQTEINRAMIEAATFAIYLVAETDEIEAKYGVLARDFSMVEAGAMTQLLMDWATGLGLGLCPVGGFDPVHLAQRMDLGEHRFLALTLVGGVPA